MTEALLTALWIGTILYFGCKEMSTRKERESHEWWLSELRECLRGIEGEFSNRCQKLAENAIKKHDYSLFNEQIKDLKTEYQNNVYNKVKARKGEYFLKTLPEYIEKQYLMNISNIEYTFSSLVRNIVYFS